MASKKPTNIESARKKCDALLTPIAKKKHPACEACGNPTQVGHHWIEKSRSNYLRYDVDRNIISLCQSCHTKIHNRFGASVTGALDVAEIIISKRGKKWKAEMDKESAVHTKVDLYFYLAHLERLQEILSTL